MIPAEDTQYEECAIDRIEGRVIHRSDGWSFCLPLEWSGPWVGPAAAGDVARFYGGGIGRPVRGLAINGVEVFYRTEEEYERWSLGEMYGKTPRDLIERWDRGETIWSVEMGGLGPGYEQALQMAMVEFLRHMVYEGRYDPVPWTKKERWTEDLKSIEAAGFKNERITRLRLSGAQWGSAISLAARFFRDFPVKVMQSAPQDRKIQVCRDFPGGS